MEQKTTCELCDGTGSVERFVHYRDQETGYEEVDGTGEFYPCVCVEEDNHEQDA